VTDFDVYSADYVEALQRGLKYSGEDSDYFAMGRVQWLARQLKELPLAPTSLLDFGCGNGASTPHFLSMLNVDVTGIDVSEGLLERARLDHGSPRVRYSLRKDYTPAGRMDIAFCNGVFHHIKPSDRPSALEYVNQSLRVGGLFAFCENNPWNPLWSIAGIMLSHKREHHLSSRISTIRFPGHAGFGAASDPSSWRAAK
jgi:SAM-dependent methyltransferase